MDVEGTVDSLK